MASALNRTRRWWIASVVVGLGVALGLALGRPGPILVGLVGVVFLAGTALTAVPDPDFTVNRELSAVEPDPGTPVEVSLTVENDGRFVPDLRLVDGVPGELTVIEGSPRLATALLPGEEATISYTVRAERGQHGFDAVTAVLRNVGGTREEVHQIPVESIFTSEPALTDVPLRSQTSQLAGDLMTDTPGTGLEFYSVREYRSGDPLSRVDWGHLAKRGTLSTVQYREERAAEVMVVIDARPSAYWTPTDASHHAVERAVTAAGRVVGTLLEGGDRVGVTAFGAESCWIEPGAGTEHEGKVRHLLATHPDLSYTPPDDVPELAIHADHEPLDPTPLLNRLRPDTQVIVISPLCDDGIVEAIRDIDARGHAVTVIAADPTGSATRGQRLAAIQRRNRLHGLRRAGVRVMPWDLDESLLDALTRAGRHA